MASVCPGGGEGGGGYRICMYGIHKIERRTKTK